MLFEAIHYAKTTDEETGAKIIEQFQFEQTALAQAIFAIFPGIIAEENQEIVKERQNLPVVNCYLYVFNA